MKYDVCVVGGAGHVGAPLAVVLAARGFSSLILDKNVEAVKKMASGKMPFLEDGGEDLLARTLASGKLHFSLSPSDVADAAVVIVTIGTPVDEFGNPTLRVIEQCINELLPHLVDEQIVILRSTISPGVTEWVGRRLQEAGKNVGVAFCPERVVQGRAIEEIQTLPQLVSGTSKEAEEKAAEFFSRIAPKIVRMSTKEAEFAKLVCNAYRYIQFGATNQFYMMVEAAGCDYHRVLSGLKEGYPRADLPSPGFAAGPCLLKDTLQLAASAGVFDLGLAAMRVNESLPSFIVDRISINRDLRETTVGILGMAFKAESDDVRSSLSYKLKKILKYKAKAVLTSDPLVSTDPDLLPIEQVIKGSSVLILAVPHAAYAELDFADKDVIDVWGTR